MYASLSLSVFVTLGDTYRYKDIFTQICGEASILTRLPAGTPYPRFQSTGSVRDVLAAKEGPEEIEEVVLFLRSHLNERVINIFIDHSVLYIIINY